MARDYFYLRRDLPDRPELASIQRATGLSVKHAVLGCLCALGANAAIFGDERGFILHHTAETVDDLVGVQGFAAALQAVGWLIVTDAGVRVTGFLKVKA